MKQTLRQDADYIISCAISAVQPDEAVARCLRGQSFSGDLYLVAVGKAAWQMADAAVRCLSKPIKKGIVVTKYDHVKGPIPGVISYEAGHPVPDDHSYRATEEVLSMTAELTEQDTVLFLLSGGGSALFEQPLISPEEMKTITGQLLSVGADIIEMNTIRKRLSGVKGGRFGQWCAPARVYSIILSDILGDPLDMIASGPAAPDSSTCAEALAIAEKYQLSLSKEAFSCLQKETPKTLKNVTSHVIGSVRQLCRSAALACEQLGYQTVFLTDLLSCQAKEAGAFLGSVARTYAAGTDIADAEKSQKIAFIAGGETVVQLTGKGLGGRNQELALAAAEIIDGLPGTAVFSVGSDGTDGPTDAAGGYVDGQTAPTLRTAGLTISQVLSDNDAYHALEKTGGLIFTGPTGTNVNDVAVALVNLKN